MALIECRDLGKTFGSKGAQTVALQGVNVVFPTHGLVVIHGSSGSGKSTLLNLLCGMEVPTTGSVLFDQKPLSDFSLTELSHFRRQKIGRVFQHYELFDDLDVVTNACLTLLISGESLPVAQKRAQELLQSYGLGNYSHKKAHVLSGGEKQRVALIRAMIHGPEVLLADEPTGALDQKNAALVMNMLNEYAKKALVIVVTHDLALFKPIADGFIQLSDGNITSLELPPEETLKPTQKEWTEKSKKAPTWPNLLASHHLQSRKKINTLGIVASGIAWASCLVTLGFASGSPQAIAQASERYFDYGTASIAKVLRMPIENSPLTLMQSRRPSISEMAQISTRFDSMRFRVDLSPVFANLTLVFERKEFQSFSFCPVQSFTFSAEQKRLLYEGTLPAQPDFSQVIINQEMARLLAPSQTIGKLLGKRIILRTENTVELTLPGDTYQKVHQTFSFEQEFTLSAVVSETPFLNEPRIFYCHRSAMAYLDQKFLLLEEDTPREAISWLACLETASPDSLLSAYHYLVFLSNPKASESLYRFSQTQSPTSATYDIVSHAFVSRQAFDSIAEILNLALILFVGIALLGSLFILGLSGYSSFVSHFKESAILLTLGATNREIRSIFLLESLSMGTFSSCLGIIASLPLETLMNLFLGDSLGISSPIRIPFDTFLGFPFLLVWLVLILSMGLSLCATGLPIVFFKQGTLATYLRDE